jgi:TolB protein
MRRILFVVMLVLLAAPQVAHAAGDRILFLSDRAGPEGRELYLVDRDGKALKRLTFNNIQEQQPVWSPDRSRIAFAGLRDGSWDIYTVLADGSNLKQLTHDAATDGWPKWTPDGGIVFIHGEPTCPCRPRIVNANGSGLAELPIPGDILTLEPAPHGRRVVFARVSAGRVSLHVADWNGRDDRKITDGGAFGDANARWSPRGDRIAFLRSDEATDSDVYVVDANGKHLRALTDTPGRVESFPAWSSDGSEVLFGTGAGDLMAVSLAGGSEKALSTVPRAPLVETFDDGPRESSFWHEISDPGSKIGKVGGSLVVSISGDAIPGGQYNQIDAHWGSNCNLPGDFDYQVDYKLLLWPQHGGFFASLNAFFADAAIARQSDPWDPPYDEQYGAWRGRSTPTSGAEPAAGT